MRTRRYNFDRSGFMPLYPTLSYERWERKTAIADRKARPLRLPYWSWADWAVDRNDRATRAQMRCFFFGR